MPGQGKGTFPCPTKGSSGASGPVLIVRAAVGAAIVPALSPLGLGLLALLLTGLGAAVVRWRRS